MTVISQWGHDISGTTTNRPTNAEPGMTYFDTTTQTLMVLNSAGTWQDAADSSSPTVNGAAGTAGSGTAAGGAGGTASVAGGAGGAKSGTGAAAGGAGGAVSETGGAGGNTASSGSDAGGAGGSASVTGGAGGNATAGTGNGGAGGSVVLTPGAGGTSAGGTAGAIGTISLAGPVSSPVTAAQTIATGNTITLPTSGRNKLLNNAGAVTGIILTAGRVDGEEICLLNNTANSVTFAAAGTSNVADGTSAVIAANTAMRLVWSTTATRWFHGN